MEVVAIWSRDAVFDSRICRGMFSRGEIFPIMYEEVVSVSSVYVLYCILFEVTPYILWREGLVIVSMSLHVALKDFFHRRPFGIRSLVTVQFKRKQLFHFEKNQLKY